MRAIEQGARERARCSQEGKRSWGRLRVWSRPNRYLYSKLLMTLTLGYLPQHHSQPTILKDFQHIFAALKKKTLIALQFTDNLRGKYHRLGNETIRKEDFHQFHFMWNRHIIYPTSHHEKKISLEKSGAHNLEYFGLFKIFYKIIGLNNRLFKILMYLPK